MYRSPACRGLLGTIAITLMLSIALAEENPGLTQEPVQRIIVPIGAGTHLDLPKLQALGVRVVSIRPDPSGEADALVEALVNEGMFRALQSTGALQAVPGKTQADGG